MRKARITALALSATLLGAGLARAAGSVQVTVDVSVQHQTWYGFGATQETLVYGGTGDVFSASQRQRAVSALFNEVKITTGQIPTIFESSASSTLATFWANQGNDNSDPLVIDPNGFYSGLGDTFKSAVIDIAGSKFDLYPNLQISTRWANTWMQAIQSSNYDAFLNECAEHVLAGVQYWKTTYNETPTYGMLFNEPLSGNSELVGGSPSTVVDIVRRSGERLASAGFGSVRFVVPGEETEDKSLSTATAVMNDANARQYVGAIAYHPYPYGSTYSYVPNILATSGAGSPDSGRIQVRNQLRDLGGQYGVPVWMTEVSHAYMESDNVQATDFRVLRGRAIHIHDELAYADAAAYFGMNSLWDSVSQANHFGTDGSEMTIAEHDTIVLVKQSTDEIIITGMGRAIGHYARFIQRGAKRVDASSSDPLLLVSAFRDDTQGGRLVLVVINNASQDEVINVSVSGAVLAGDLGGEQSTAAAVWQPLAPITPTGASNFSLTVPAESVTTVATAAGAGGAGTGGASGAGGLGSSGTGGTAGVGGVTSGGTGGSAVSLGGAVSSGTAGAVVATGGGTSGNQGNASGGAGAGTSDKGGCGCRLLGRPPASKGAAVLALALALLLLQRRGRRR